MSKSKLRWNIFFLAVAVFMTAFSLWCIVDNVIKCNPWYYYLAIVLPGTVNVFWWIATIRFIRDKDLEI